MEVSEQCGIAASKGNIQGTKLIIHLYKAIVRPHLAYCIQAIRIGIRKYSFSQRTINE